MGKFGFSIRVEAGCVIADDVLGENAVQSDFSIMLKLVGACKINDVDDVCGC